MYLSRLCLNPLFAPALKLAADPYALHCKLLDTLHDHCCKRENGEKKPIENQPKTADLLFRVDTTDSGPVVLIQSGVTPDWDALELAPRALRCQPETKPYSLEFARGQRFAFRLFCQPAFRKSGQYGIKLNEEGNPRLNDKGKPKRKTGPRRLITSDEELYDWLRRKSHESGFIVESVGLTYVDWLNSKPLQKQGGETIESHEDARKRIKRDPHQRLGAVRFDGVLIVTAPAELSGVIAKGIGAQKAFGFGLLSIAPVK